MAIGIICKTDGASQGYVTFLRNAFTGATGGVATFTDVPQPGKLLGVHTFETTGAADITTDGDHRTTQSVRTESITVGRKDVLGPIYTTTADAINGGFEIGAINDEGYSFWNLGFHNEVGPLGIPSGTATIPSDMEIRTNTGAADAIRVHAVTLNTNV